jgi:hypothetical protein
VGKLGREARGEGKRAAAAHESGGEPLRPTAPAPFRCSTSTASIDSRRDLLLRPPLHRFAPPIFAPRTALEAGADRGGGRGSGRSCGLEKREGRREQRLWRRHARTAAPDRQRAAALAAGDGREEARLICIRTWERDRLVVGCLMACTSPSTLLLFSLSSFFIHYIWLCDAVLALVWRRLAARHTRLGVSKVVGRHASPYRRKNHDSTLIARYLKHCLPLTLPFILCPFCVPLILVSFGFHL